MGQAAGAIEDVKPAAQIITEMVSQAISIINANHQKIIKAKL
jgi:NAD(P)H-dependent flavin oxidoreductase YrpB (nitropropane dioxygenase family)